MRQYDAYTREAVKIYNQIIKTIMAAETDTTLRETERNIIKSILIATRDKLAEGISDLVQLCSKYEE